MKKLKFTDYVIGFLLVLIVMIATACIPVYAIDVDPTVEPIKTLNCIMPLEYDDNTPIPEGDIAEIRLYESTQSGVYGQTPIATSANCTFNVPTTDKQEGITYYYVVTAVSTAYGTESLPSNEQFLDIVVQRVPKPPTNLGWQ